MAGSRVRVNLSEPKFLALNYRTGHIGRFTNGLVGSIVTTAKLRCPSRTSRLRDSITHEVTSVTPGHVELVITASMPYASYVHKGTSTIVSAGMRMYSPRGPFGDRSFDAAATHPDRTPWVGARIDVVAGQAPQNFLSSAASDMKRQMLQ
jgi:hypothetical protein